MGMQSVFATSLFWIGIALIIGVGAYFYFVRTGLSEQEALRKAVRIAVSIWDVSDFTAPAALKQPQVAAKLLREAGLVLKAEVVGNSTNAHALTEYAAKPHPELVRVDPLELAIGVQKAILGGLAV